MVPQRSHTRRTLTSIYDPVRDRMVVFGGAMFAAFPKAYAAAFSGFYLALYAWHGRHHVAHITSLRERMGW